MSSDSPSAPEVGRPNPCCLTTIPLTPTLDYAEFTCPLCGTKWVNEFDASGWHATQSDEGSAP